MPNWVWLVIVFVLLIAVLPSWPHAAAYGPYPGGVLGVVLLILLVLILTGRL